jgi:hypothetical protein
MILLIASITVNFPSLPYQIALLEWIFGINVYLLWKRENNALARNMKCVFYWKLIIFKYAKKLLMSWNLRSLWVCWMFHVIGFLKIYFDWPSTLSHSARFPKNCFFALNERKIVWMLWSGELCWKSFPLNHQFSYSSLFSVQIRNSGNIFIGLDIEWLTFFFFISLGLLFDLSLKKLSLLLHQICCWMLISLLVFQLVFILP